MKNSVASWIVALRMPIVLAVLIIVASILTGGKFTQADNVIIVAQQISFEALIAFGMTFVIVTGGIDLSVGSLVALCGVLGGLVMRATLGWPAMTYVAAGMSTAISLGAGVGLLSGSIITRFSIPPFIVTLAAMLIARGFAFISCAGQPIYELPQPLIWLGRGVVFESVLGRTLPVPVMIMLLGFLVFHVLLTRTVFGREVTAVGGNEVACRFSGVAVKCVKTSVYLLTGGLCGLVSVLYDAKLGAADPKVGEMLELNVIAAVVVGGTSLFGGSGTIMGTLVGALIIGVLNNSLNLMHVEHFWQKVVLGAVLLAASLLDGALRKLAVR
jgi:ribose/xylose/arabinose/galactoside ABC-type transport system permease subunit